MPRSLSRLRSTAALITGLFAAISPAVGAELKSSPPAPMTSAPEFTLTQVPARIADLAFSYLRPANFQLVTIPDEKPDFEQPTAFYPLQVVMANYGAVLFSTAARPAYSDGTVQDWAEFLLKENAMELVSMKPVTLGGLPALLVEVTQASDAGPMRIRTALLEDGNRLLNLSIMAPAAIWPSVEPMLNATLTSFRLVESKGTSTPLMRKDAKPAEKAAKATPAKAAPAAPAAAAVTAPESQPTPAAELALADDAASFDPEHPLNVRLRNKKAGLTPRILETNQAEKYVVLGAGALESVCRVPFGWHVVDDGRRTLILDAGGKIQISINLRRDDGDHQALLEQIQTDTRKEQPEIDPLMVNFAPDLPGLILRNYRDGADVLVQAFIVKHVRDDGLAHVTRVTAAPDDMSRAMNLAEIIVRSLGTPVAAY